VTLVSVCPKIRKGLGTTPGLAMQVLQEFNYILAHHILAPFSGISRQGKNMMGKNIIELSDQVNRCN
jgi:hypothetical protein